MYVELHCCSAFSFLEGASLPEDLIAEAARLEMPAIALLDHDGIYGAPRFHMAAVKAGVRAHVGAEVSVEGFGMQASPPTWMPNQIPASSVRLALLVENRKGYQNLCRLITRYKLREQDKGSGAATLDEIREHAEGIVCLTGGEEGVLAAALSRGGETQAKREIERLISIFGKHNVFVEVQRHLDPLEEDRIQAAVQLAKRLNLPLLATNGIHYAHRYDREVLDVLTCIRNHCRLETAGRLLERNDERHLRSSAAMARLFSDLPQATATASELSVRLEYSLADLGYQFPLYPVPSGETMDSFLGSCTLCGETR